MKDGGRRDGKIGRQKMSEGERKGREGGREEGGREGGKGDERKEGGGGGGGDLHELVLKLLHLAWLCSQLHEQVQPERHHCVEDPHECFLCQRLLPEQLVEEEEERE